MYWWGLLKFPSPPGENTLPGVRPDAGMAAPQEAALHKLMKEEFPAMAPDSNL